MARQLGDVRRVQGILDAFAQPWWAAVVYTCFDSEIGTLAVAEVFPHPVDPAEATRRLLRIDLPVGAVRHHRTQPGHVGAKAALVSACGSAHDFERILREGQGRPRVPCGLDRPSQRVRSDLGDRGDPLQRRRI